MDWIKKHVDTVIILTAFGSSVIWMNGKFNEVDRQFAQVDRQFAQVEKKFSEIHEDLAVMKAVLIMKKIIPCELANSSESEIQK